jgi:hypothetical protein
MVIRAFADANILALPAMNSGLTETFRKSASVVPTLRKSRRVGQPQFGMVSTIKIKGGPAPEGVRRKNED